MNSLASKRLDELAKKISPDRDIYKLDINDVYKIGLTNKVVGDIKECISSDKHEDISNGFFYLSGLLQKYKLKDFGKEFYAYLIKRIPVLIETNLGTQACYYAIDFYIWLKDNYSDYREKMLKLLSSEDLGCRQAALHAYETYAKPNEVEPLLCFQNDPDVAELSMCGPLEYQSRNLALEKIGNILSKNFMTTKVRERHSDWGNDYVSWYDWEPFLNWYSKQKRKN